MKTFAAAGLAALAFLAFLAFLCGSAAHAGPGPVKPAGVFVKPLLTCTTPGDALGGLAFNAAAGVLTMTENGMDGSVTKIKLEQTPTDTNKAADALTAGRAFSAFFRVKANGAEFGGGIADAGVLTVGAKGNGARVGYLARKGMVYVLGCKG